MKHKLFLLFIGMLMAGFLTAQNMPKISSATEEHWYYIQFKNGNAVIQDMGDNSEVITKAKSATNEAQLWKVTGTPGQYTLIAKSGRKMNFSSSFFRASSLAEVKFKFISSTNDTYSPAWELQREGSTQAINQYQAAGTERKLGEWTVGDNNNPLVFIPQNPISELMPEVSTPGNEIWYYIQFSNGNAVLQDMGEGQNIKTKLAADRDAQLWKVTGTKDNYVIESKLGNKISLSGNHFQTSLTESSSFIIKETGSSKYSPALELQRVGATGCMNQEGGSGPNRDLREYNYGSIYNPLVFVKKENLIDTEAIIKGQAGAPSNKYSLWYRTPAKVWMTHALPIGNGQFGAMVFGGIRKEEVQFNDKTLWSGSSNSYGYYQNFGNLFIENKNFEEVSDYRRELDIQNGIARVTFKADDVVYTREYFVSYPDNALVVNLTASEPGKIDANLTLADGRKTIVNYDNQEARFSGELDLLSYYARMAVKNEGGAINTDDNGIRIEGANSVTIVLRGNTNFDDSANSYIYPANQLANKVSKIVTDASAKSYETLKNNHVNDYKSLFGRLSFNLDGTQNTMPTDELITNYNSTANKYKNLFLEELYFHYGRYLMISSARAGVHLPSNLQGIWNHINNPPWHSDIHANINVQMNYWPAENTNLSEMHSSLLNYIHKEATKVNGQWSKNAKNSGQTKGWTMFTENNIFGYHGGFMHNYVIANAWYCMHLWQHYRYTLDINYLKEIAFEPMKLCCDYWLERLILASDGTYECPNEYSPEHGPGSQNATAHSQQLVWDLFNNTLEAIDVLGEDYVDAAFLADLKNKFAKLDQGLAIEKSTGQLKEWKYSANSVGEKGHRHMSHLMGLYPGNQISPLINKEFFDAAIVSMIDRGDQSTGWSMGWKINLWARALNGERARGILNMALRLSKSLGTNQYDGGIYQNLFDSHSPFQIDGNFGACAGIAEMLLQSHTGVIQILPALPKEWKSGNIYGIRAVNKFEVDIDWKNGRATEILVKSFAGKDCIINYSNIKNAKITDENQTPVTFSLISDDQISFPTEQGKIYTIEIIEGGDTYLPKVSEKKINVIIKNNKITVEGNNIDTVDIYNLIGQKVYTEKKPFYFSYVDSGSYILSAKKNDGWVENEKIIVK